MTSLQTDNFVLVTRVSYEIKVTSVSCEMKAIRENSSLVEKEVCVEASNCQVNFRAFLKYFDFGLYFESLSCIFIEKLLAKCLQINCSLISANDVFCALKATAV